MEIITGYVGKPHVTSEQDRDVHIGMIGSGSYVLQTGKQMTAEISSNNEIKVRDGVLMHQGCAASIKKNTYDSLSIVNGSQGMKRIDLIVARYERNKNTGVESLTLKVLKGTPASANPATPAYTTGDIQAGDYIADMPMYKVTLDGINITKLEKQFQTVETNAALTQKVNVLNSTLTGAIRTKTYSMTLTANNYVPPFSMFGEGIIPDADIKKYGSPIAICAIQKSSAPGAAALRWNIGRSAWQYIACSNMAEVDVNITFLKLN